MRHPTFACASLALAGLLLSQAADASYGFYVGKNLTVDGSVLLAGTGEEVSSHWLEIVPRKVHPDGATVTVGVTDAARYRGVLTEIPQVRETFKYITMNYSDFAGFPAPLTNGGLNEHQVAIRDIWAPSRQELRDMTPNPQHGPQYSDLARIALERATTAREAVRIIGGLIDKHGFSTYGGNVHLIADPEEGWVIWEFAGGQGLWAAERLGADDIRVAYPGSIEEIPRNYRRSPDYMGSDNLIDFAVRQGWYDPESGGPFNIHDVYGKQGVPAREPRAKYMSPAQLEKALGEMVPVSVDDMMARVRDRRIADDEAGYGQVAHLRDDLPHPDLALLWVAPTGAVAAPFLPWWIGVKRVPPEFGQHRYLTKDAASTFLNPEYQTQEATRFAGRVYKQLMYYTCARPDVFLEPVTATLEAFEARLLSDRPRVERAAAILYRSDRRLGAEALTFYSNSRAMDALRLGEDLLAGIGAQAKTRFGIANPDPAAPINSPGGETVNCLVGADPDQPR